MAGQGTWDIAGCINCMEHDLQNQTLGTNYLIYPDLLSTWNAFLEDLKNQRWSIVTARLQTFEDTFYRIYRFRFEHYASYFPNYLRAKAEIIKIITGHQNQQKPNTADLYTVGASGNVTSTDIQYRQTNMKQHLMQMEQDLQNRYENYMRVREVATAWQAFCKDLENQQWSTIAKTLIEFEAIFSKWTRLKCEKDSHLFPNYRTSRDKLLQMIAEQQNLTCLGESSLDTVPATPPSTDGQSSPIDIKTCISLMQTDLRDGSMNHLEDSGILKDWLVLRQNLQNQRWNDVPESLSCFEETFFKRRHFRCESHHSFPKYKTARDKIQQKIKDQMNLKKQEQSIFTETATATTTLDTKTSIEKPPSNSSLDADYLQRCIAWLEKSLKQDVPDTHVPRKADTGISTQATENAKKLELVYKDFVRTRERNSELKQHNLHLQQETNQQKQQIQQLQRQDKASQHVKTELDRLQNEVKLLQQKLNSAEADKQYWMNRVSKVAGTKLTTNNPGITDLSDPNRPQKLAEKFGELYDNTWTDSLELLNDNTAMNEIESIKRLALFLKRCYQCCDTLSHKHVNDLRSVLLTLTIGEDSSGSDDVRISKSLLDARKETSSGALNAVRKEIAKKVKGEFATEAMFISDFMNSCVDICWGMVVHEPKLCFLWLDEGRHKTVNPDQFSLYTRSGTGVEFLVWPAMLLHEDGPLLRKGTYQPFEDKKYR